MCKAISKGGISRCGQLLAFAFVIGVHITLAGAITLEYAPL